MRSRFQRDGLIRPELIKRIFTYGLLLLILSAAQCAFFGRIKVLPATPDLILGALVAVLLVETRQTAAVFGIAGGILLDAVGSVGVSLRPICYLLVVVFVGVLAEKMMPSLLSWLILMLPALLLRGIFTLCEIYLFADGVTLRGALGQVVLPELICTTVLCLPLYGIVRLCAHLLKDKRDRSLR